MNKKSYTKDLRDLLRRVTIVAGRSHKITHLNYILGQAEYIESKSKEINDPYWLEKLYGNAIYFLKLRDLIVKYKISNAEIHYVYEANKKPLSDWHERIDLNTCKETRDNKGVYVGSGGSNCRRIRYPKKNRSRQTWKKFYEMFPYIAERDNWNGKTSKRMK